MQKSSRPFVRREAPRGGLPAGLSAARRPVSRAVAATGQGLYLDVSMFSSLKLLQCSITFLQTMGERGKAGWGRAWARPLPADQASEFVSKG